MSGRKRVKGTASKGKKRVPVAPGPQPDTRHLVWRFGRLSHGGPFGCQTLTLRDVPGLERELVTFQKTPIWQLKMKGWLKFIDAEEMTNDGQQCFASLNSQDNGLWQLHLHRDKWRIWGYFETPEFFFLWWDSKHAVAVGKSRHRKT